MMNETYVGQWAPRSQAVEEQLAQIATRNTMLGVDQRGDVLAAPQGPAKVFPGLGGLVMRSHAHISSPPHEQ